MKEVKIINNNKVIKKMFGDYIVDGFFTLLFSLGVVFPFGIVILGLVIELIKEIVSL